MVAFLDRDGVEAEPVPPQNDDTQSAFLCNLKRRPDLGKRPDPATLSPEWAPAKVRNPRARAICIQR